jgi:hypothetical protein
MPRCMAYPGPLSVLVMDNAKIHHDDAILELADRFGECTIYCPVSYNLYASFSMCRGSNSIPPTQ